MPASLKPRPETKPVVAAPGESDWGSRGHVRTLVLMGATLFGLYLCYRLTVPFLPALVWALALAVMFAPMQRWLDARLKKPSLTAALSVLVIGLIVVVPTIFVGQQLVQQATNGAGLIETKLKSGEWARAFDAQSRIGHYSRLLAHQVDLPDTIKSFSSWLRTTAGAFVKGSVIQLVGLALTFYLLFFFLRDGRALLQSIRRLLPLSEVEMDRMYRRIDDTIYATIYGTLAVAALQGLLGGLMFAVLGLPGPLLWGVVMALLAVVPVLGAFVVWMPAALYLILEGSWEKALLLTLWGLLVVGTIDNLLRPILAGNRLKLHTVLAFISVVGGLMLFGAAGLILGPMILTITLVLLEIWPAHHRAGPAERIEPEELVRFETDGGPGLPGPGGD